MKITEKNKRKIIIGLLAGGVIFLIIGLSPLYPQIFWYIRGFYVTDAETIALENMAGNIKSTSATDGTLAENINPRIIIPSIGVDMEIVTDEKNEKKAFSRGAWLLPGTAEPGDTSGNAVIAAHRYKFISGPKTFYHLDKLKAGDDVKVHWRGQDFVYEVVETKIVEPDDVSILEPSAEPILTLFTCHPVYTTDSRLVVTTVLVR